MCLCQRNVSADHHYINLDTGISSDVSKFADDTKIGRVIRSNQDASILQNELDNLYEWAEKWQMRFIVGKRSTKSVGRTNPTYQWCGVGFSKLRLRLRLQ